MCSSSAISFVNSTPGLIILKQQHRCIYVVLHSLCSQVQRKVRFSHIPQQQWTQAPCARTPLDPSVGSDYTSIAFWRWHKQNVPSNTQRYWFRWKRERGFGGRRWSHVWVDDRCLRRILREKKVLNKDRSKINSSASMKTFSVLLKHSHLRVVPCLRCGSPGVNAGFRVRCVRPYTGLHKNA